MRESVAMRDFVKICGLPDVTCAGIAAAAGADALGFVLAPTRRRVDPSVVVETRQHLATMNEAPRLVAIVVNEHEGALRRTVEAAGPDVVQLSGDETPSVLDWISTAVFRTIRIPHDVSVDQVRAMIDPWLDHPKPADAVLVEAYSAGHFGGTGKLANWEICARLAETYPLILAGGLTPDNVGSGIETVRPHGVDVSSGVETEGIKDPERIRRFIERARQAFQGRQEEKIRRFE